MIPNMMDPNLKSHFPQHVRIFSILTPFMNDGFGVICYLTAVGFIDNELVGVQPGAL